MRHDMHPEYQHFYVSRVMVNSQGKNIVVKEPRVTVCYIRNTIGTAVGISVCSYGDNPNKTIGRGRAYQRALEASSLIECGTVDPQEDYIISQERAWEVILDTDMVMTKEYKMVVVADPNFRFTRKNTNN